MGLIYDHQINVIFDPILAGHTVTIAASAYDQNRTGVSKIASLRWSNYNSTTVLVDNDGNDHTVTLALGINNISDNPLEYLVNVLIPEDSIESSSAQCWVDEGNNSVGVDNDMLTDINGRITFIVHTRSTDSFIQQCEITWSKTNGGIYREY